MLMYDCRMHIRPVRERDLGRIQMVGSLTIVFIILVIIGNFIVYAQHETHAKKLHTQKEHLIRQALTGLEQEGEQLCEYINYYRQLTGERLKESVRERVLQAFAIAQTIAHNTQGPQTRTRIKEVLSQLQWRGGNSYIWIIDKEGRVVLFGSNPAMEGKQILDISDAGGKHIVRELLGVAMNKGEGYVEDITMQITSDRNVEQVAFVKYLPSLEWVIGTGETIDDIEMTTKAELIARIKQMRLHSGSIGILDTKNNLLVGKKRPLNNHIEQSLKKTLRYQNGDGDELLFAKKIPKWDWTVYIMLPLEKIKTPIAELEATLDADLHQNLIILAILFLSISILSVFLSYLLSHRLRLTFRQYRSRSLNQRKSMRRLYRKLTLEQQRSNEALEAKNRFLSNLSHELHTPLTALMGYANLLTQQLPEPYRKNAQVIAEASEQLLVLQNDLIACANAQKMPVVENYFDIAKMSRHLYRVFEHEAQKHDCTWSLFGADTPVMVTGDQAKIYRMLLALLESIFHNTAHSTVQLHLHQPKGRVRIFVCDSSPPENAAVMNTDAFQKAHQSLGAGALQSNWAVVHSHAKILNLAMHQRLLKRLGRCFWFSLPCGLAPKRHHPHEMLLLENSEYGKLVSALGNGRLASIKEIAQSVHDDATRKKLEEYLGKGDIPAMEQALTLYGNRHHGHF